MPSNALYRTPDSVMNALSGPPKVMGVMDPNVNRLSLLPRYNQREGLVAPQWLYDLARAAEAPGNALMGLQTTSEDAVNFGLNFAGAGLGTSAAMKAPAPGPGKTIAATVYHGSPHNFDKFDMSKIGTGEGAQAYGHGLYVAESPDVAKSYSTLGHVKGQVSTIKGRNITDVYEELNNSAARMPVQQAQANYDRMALLENLMNNQTPSEVLKYAKANGYSPDVVSWFEKQVIPHYNGSGKLYTVDLPDSAIANMLDWGAPLSQQPEAVRKAINAAGVTDDSVTGDRALQLLFKQARKEMGSNLGAAEYQRAVSEKLKSLGITGIRYLDGGSRSAGNGTRNFVVFDDKLLTILGKE